MFKSKINTDNEKKLINLIKTLGELKNIQIKDTGEKDTDEVTEKKLHLNFPMTCLRRL